MLYVRHEDVYVHCLLIAPLTHRETTRQSTLEDLPPTAVPMLVKGSKSPLHLWKEKQESIYRDIEMRANAATFVQYVAALPQWESEFLLQHIELMESPVQVMDNLSQDIRLVSDGSNWDHIHGSFGWMMSDTNGERWAKGMGPAHGSRTNSYRLESYGMLAGLCFLRRLAEYTGRIPDWRGILGTDSQSLIDTILGQHFIPIQSTVDDDAPLARVVRHHPLDPLLPDWDVVRGIQVLLQSTPMLTLKHIPGHQDRTVHYQNLSLLAQLNVDADRLADQYQRDHGHHQPIVPLTEWAGVHLILPQGTITSKHEAALRYQSTGPPLLEVMKLKYRWTDRSSSLINWRAHGASLRKQMPKRTHLIKLVHGLLPTNASVHRHDTIRRMCPACTTASEQWHHMLQCPHEARREWRQTALAAIDTACAKGGTKPELRHLLFDALSGWLHHDVPGYPFLMSLSSYPKEVHRLILAQQNDIGWDHLFLGRFSLEWGQLQDDYYARQVNRDKTKRRTGHQWQVTIIGKLWEQWFLVWDMRNADKHGVDSTARACIGRSPRS